MEKAYLNIRVETSGSAPTVVQVVVSDRPAGDVPGESSDCFWATVDECEAQTFKSANREILERLHRAAKKIRSFEVLLELFEEHHWEPELSDALGG